MFFRPELVAEGGKAAETDVEDDTKGPDVDSTGILAVFAILKYFGCNIGGSAA